MQKKIVERLLSIKRKGIEGLVQFMLYDSDYFTAPASSRYHNNFDGGLAIHSDNVVEMLLKKNRICNLGLSEETIYLTGYTHDICKVNIYHKTLRKKLDESNGLWSAYETYEIKDELPLGHGEKSLALVMRFLELTDEECLMIRWHMGTQIPQEYQPTLKVAQDKYPSVLALSLADIEASKFMEKVYPQKQRTMDEYNRFVRGILEL